MQGSHLNGVNVVSDDNQLSLLGLNQSGDVVDTVFHNNGLLSLVNLVASGNGLGSSSKTGLLFLLALGAVLVEELEQLSGYFRESTN